jgi:hypothetical protein
MNVKNGTSNLQKVMAKSHSLSLKEKKSRQQQQLLPPHPQPTVIPKSPTKGRKKNQNSVASNRKLPVDPRTMIKRKRAEKNRLT